MANDGRQMDRHITRESRQIDCIGFDDLPIERYIHWSSSFFITSKITFHLMRD